MGLGEGCIHIRKFIVRKEWEGGGSGLETWAACARSVCGGLPQAPKVCQSMEACIQTMCTPLHTLPAAGCELDAALDPVLLKQTFRQVRRV